MDKVEQEGKDAAQRSPAHPKGRPVEDVWLSTLGGTDPIGAIWRGDDAESRAVTAPTGPKRRQLWKSTYLVPKKTPGQRKRPRRFGGERVDEVREEAPSISIDNADGTSSAPVEETSEAPPTHPPTESGSEPKELPQKEVVDQGEAQPSPVPTSPGGRRKSGNGKSSVTSVTSVSLGAANLLLKRFIVNKAVTEEDAVKDGDVGEKYQAGHVDEAYELLRSSTGISKYSSVGSAFADSASVSWPLSSWQRLDAAPSSQAPVDEQIRDAPAPISQTEVTEQVLSAPISASQASDGAEGFDTSAPASQMSNGEQNLDTSEPSLQESLPASQAVVCEQEEAHNVAVFQFASDMTRAVTSRCVEELCCKPRVVKVERSKDDNAEIEQEIVARVDTAKDDNADIKHEAIATVDRAEDDNADIKHEAIATVDMAEDDNADIKHEAITTVDVASSTVLRSEDDDEEPALLVAAATAFVAVVVAQATKKVERRLLRRRSSEQNTYIEVPTTSWPNIDDDDWPIGSTHSVCVCGGAFLPDATSCRLCGMRRPPPQHLFQPLMENWDAPRGPARGESVPRMQDFAVDPVGDDGDFIEISAAHSAAGQRPETRKPPMNVNNMESLWPLEVEVSQPVLERKTSTKRVSFSDPAEERAELVSLIHTVCRSSYEYSSQVICNDARRECDHAKYWARQLLYASVRA
jgi:hypothetical protein